MMRLHPQPDETIAGSVASLRRGQVTCRALVERCLREIDEWEQRVHAWVSVDEKGARTEADQRDAELRAGHLRGPLHGIPLGIKDLFDVEGLPTAAGSKRLASEIAASDAAVVHHLREAGAILVGKTVTTQFACFDPACTRNPWNLEHTPGGSSSGSAAAVATGMCLGAIGSQTGGSITRPASFCGVAGCKPTFGLLSVEGVFPAAPSMDHPGPIARTVEDLAILLTAMSGRDEFSGAHADLPRPPRVARLRGFFETLADPEMQSALEAAVQKLLAAGAEIIEAELPAGFEDVHRQHRVIMVSELAAHHGRWLSDFRDDYLPGIASLVEEGLAVSREIYDQARRHQARTREEAEKLFENASIAICPAALGPAPDMSTTGDPSFNSPWSFTGLPTITFPVALSRGGLPLGIQIVARRNGDADLFRVARWCERVVGG